MPAPATLEALPAEVVHRVLLSCSCRDAACLALASRRLRAAVRAAGRHWGPMAAARMRRSPYLAPLLPRLRAPPGAAGGADGAAAPDWLQVWCCLERAAHGPWDLDVSQLSRRAAPDGVLLVFEVTLQHHRPPSAGAAAPGAADGASPTAAAAAAAAAAAPAAAPACAPRSGPPPPVAVAQHAWRDNVAVLSFALDGRRVEVVVDTAGR